MLQTHHCLLLDHVHHPHDLDRVRDHVLVRVPGPDRVPSWRGLWTGWHDRVRLEESANSWSAYAATMVVASERASRAVCCAAVTKAPQLLMPSRTFWLVTEPPSFSVALHTHGFVRLARVAKELRDSLHPYASLLLAGESDWADNPTRGLLEARFVLPEQRSLCE